MSTDTRRRVGRPPATYEPDDEARALLAELKQTTDHVESVRETVSLIGRHRARLVSDLIERGAPPSFLAEALGVSPANITRLRRLAETTGEDDR